MARHRTRRLKSFRRTCCVVKNLQENSIPSVDGAINRTLKVTQQIQSCDISIFMPFIRRIPLARERGESFKFEGKLQEESLVYVMLKNISSAIERTHSLPETPLTCGIELEIVRNIILSFRKTDARKYPPRNMSITSSITFLLSTANWIDMFREIHVRFENLMGLHDQYDNHVSFLRNKQII